MQPGQDAYTVAIVGATGAVGREMLKVLEESTLSVGALRLYASARSAGEDLVFKGRSHPVHVLPEVPPDDIDVALFSAGSSVSREAAPRFAARGAVVIDNSSAWRMEIGIPLVVPEVNPRRAFEALRPGARRIIANPNCSTIQLVVALKPLSDAFGLKRVVVSTYQSVSGAGNRGVSELSAQVIGLLNHGECPPASVFPHQIAFNCIPAIGAFLDNGYTEEEWKLVRETRKIMELPDLSVVPTAVRVPVFAAHGESVLVECLRKVTVKQAQAALHHGEGITLVDRPQEDQYPMAFSAAGTDAVFVGRVRQAPEDDLSIAMWVVADNLRKGAALNAVQIAELLADGPEDDA